MACSIRIETRGGGSIRTVEQDCLFICEEEVVAGRIATVALGWGVKRISNLWTRGWKFNVPSVFLRAL